MNRPGSQAGAARRRPLTFVAAAVATWIASLALLSSPARATIYECLLPDGKRVMRNLPCESGEKPLGRIDHAPLATDSKDARATLPAKPEPPKPGAAKTGAEEPASAPARAQAGSVSRSALRCEDARQIAVVVSAFRDKGLPLTQAVQHFDANPGLDMGQKAEVLRIVAAVYEGRLKPAGGFAGIPGCN